MEERLTNVMSQESTDVLVEEGETRNRQLILEECNSFIKEYLERNQLLRTSREFERECREHHLPLPRVLPGTARVRIIRRALNRILSRKSYFTPLVENHTFRLRIRIELRYFSCIVSFCKLFVYCSILPKRPGLMLLSKFCHIELFYYSTI
jgi:hypothetical protein